MGSLLALGDAGSVVPPGVAVNDPSAACGAAIYEWRMSHVVAAPKATVAATNAMTMATMKSYLSAMPASLRQRVSGGRSSCQCGLDCFPPIERAGRSASGLRSG
jgi:hypothetical protein